MMLHSAGRIRVSAEARGRAPGDGVELAFGFWPGRGVPIVAIHGLTGSYPHFGGIAERLEGRLPLLALDLRGRGDSDKPAGPYGVAQHARDVAAAMRAFGLGPVVVVGHSMGAYIGAALAAGHPELVAGLVLLDGGYAPALPAGMPVEQVLDQLLAPSMQRLRATYPSYSAYLAYWRSQPVFRPDEWDPWIEAWLAYDLGGAPPVLRAKASEAAVREDFVDLTRREAAEANLRRVRAPLLVVRAEVGPSPGMPPLISDAVLASMRSFAPTLEDRLLPGTNHYTIVLADPAASQVADLVVEFALRRGVPS